MEYTIKTREEFLKAYKENWRDCDFFWLSEVAPELFFDEKVADKLFSIASGDDLTDMYVIKYIPKSCWNDKEFVRTALGHNGMYLLFASEDILDDPEIAQIAARNTLSVNNDRNDFRYISDKLLRDKSFLLPLFKSMEKTPIPFYYDLPRELRDDDELISALVEKNGEIYLQLPRKDKLKKKYLLLAIKSGYNPPCGVEIPEELYDDPEVIQTMLESGYYDDEEYFREVLEEQTGLDAPSIRPVLNMSTLLKLSKVSGIKIHDESDVAKALEAVLAGC